MKSMVNLRIRQALTGLAFGALLGLAGAASAVEESAFQMKKAANLDELLNLVEQRRLFESKVNADREREFQQDKAAQARLLADANAERAREEARSNQLETTFENNETLIGDQQEALDKRLGSLRELFGVLQQVSGDTRGQFEGSIISAEIPNRGEWLSELAKKMGTSTQLATIEEIEQLWFELQRNMTAQGQVTRFKTTMTLNSGDTKEVEAIRIGEFGIIADGEFLKYDLSTSSLVELGRQPASRFTDTVDEIFDAAPGEVVALGLDPTRGNLMELLTQAATLEEQIGTIGGGFAACYLPWCDGQGAEVGAVIIIIGIFGVLLALERMVSLSLIASKVNAQKKNPGNPSLDNPLGRVLKVYHDNKGVDVETLELKLGEAILGETPKLTSGISIIQVISAVAPLLGLLGTVIGMILTFQAITLFGTGDPKTMAGGISVALMTTVEGLVVAIPTVMLHSIVSSRSKSVIHTLEEQSAGIIAEHAEKHGEALG